MTQDEIIDMARQAGMLDTWEGWVSGSEAHAEGVLTSELEAFAKLVRNHYSYTHAHLWLTRIEGAVKAEREECAKFIEDEYVRQFENPWREDLAAAIRARGEA